MFVLAVAACCSNQLPTISLQETKHFGDLHAVSVGRGYDNSASSQPLQRLISYSTRPFLRASATAPVRSAAPSLAKMWDT